MSLFERSMDWRGWLSWRSFIGVLNLLRPWLRLPGEFRIRPQEQPEPPALSSIYETTKIMLEAVVSTRRPRSCRMSTLAPLKPVLVEICADGHTNFLV